LSKDEAEIFLRNRATKGFTGIMVTLLAEHGCVLTCVLSGA
jgi:hypothetical protein